MTKRDVITLVLDFAKPPYIPWSMGFTQESLKKLTVHYGTENLDPVLENHILPLGCGDRLGTDLGNDHFQDYFGVVWDRSMDKDIGNVVGCCIPEPDISLYTFPDPLQHTIFASIKKEIDGKPDLYRIFQIGFSLYERAWTLRGMENLLMDMVLNPEFVHELLQKITDYNVLQIVKALTYDIDAVYFGDDWGQQQGLIMGYDLWKKFIYPCVKRMYQTVRSAGKKVFIHSCGDVDELFEDLIEAGLNCFNPFQPEVMNVSQLMKQYSGRLCFHGGLSTQKTLPYGTSAQVQEETKRLLELGSNGGYIFAPAHAVEGDVPLENLLAFIDLVKAQIH